MKYINEIEVIEEVDVLVAGGGPAGICAAVAASRAGAKTVLCERYGAVGGNLTLGNVSPILGKVSDGTMYNEVISLCPRIIKMLKKLKPEMEKKYISIPKKQRGY